MSGIAAVVGGGLTRLTLAPLLVEGRYKSLQYKVASLLEDTAKVSGDWTKASREEVATIVESWGLPEDYTVALLSQIYARFLIELLKVPFVRLAEMNQMLRLKEILGLDDEACGDAHYQAAIEAYREVQWVDSATLEDVESVEYARISKLLFLCRSVFVNSGASDEATQYEMGRVRSAFSMTAPELLTRCDEVAGPFYDEALSGVVDNLEAGLGPEALVKLRGKLGFSEDKAMLRHREVYSAEVERLVEVGGGEAVADADRLGALAEALALDPLVATAAAAQQTRPRFAKLVRATVVDDMEAGVVSPADAARKLADARQRLLLERSDAEALYRECFRDRFAGHVIDAVASSSLETAQETAAYVRTMVAFKRGVDEILDTLGVVDYDSETEAAAFKETALAECAAELQGAAPDADRALLFQIALRNKVEDGGDADLPFLKRLLGLGDSAVDLTYRTVVEPRLDELVEPMIAAATYEPAKLQAYLASTVFPDHLYKDYAIAKYEAQLKLFQTENQVLSARRRADLDDLQAFFGLETADVKPSIKAYAGPVYKKSVLEAMGSSGGGVIIDEYKAGLEKLRDRLGMDQADAEEALRDAAADMMTPMFQAVEAAFEDSVLTKEQRSQKRKEDRGEDLFVSEDGGELGIVADGPAADGLLKEICYLVDFYEGNNLGTISDVVKASSLVASRNLNDGLKATIYKQALVKFLTTTTDQRIDGQARYRQAVAQWPKLVGLQDERAALIRQEIGREVATKYCRQALATKASLDSTDAAFVNRVAVELDTDLSEVPLNAKKLTLIDRIAKISGSDDSDAIAAVRDGAIAMGVDIAVDLKLTPAQLTELFRVEAKALIDNELMTDDASALTDSLAELAEAYGLQADADVLITKIAGNIAERFLESAQANIISQKRSEATVNLDKLVACAKIIGPEALRDALSPAVRAEAMTKTNQVLLEIYTRARGLVDKARVDSLQILLAEA